MRRLCGLLLAISVLLAISENAPAARLRVARPPLPQPMPELIIAECPGLEGEASGCYLGVGEADVNGRVYARGAAYTTGHYRFAVLHELGHAFDTTMMDAGERDRFAHLMDMDLLLWTWSDIDDQGRLIQAPGTPAEKFADAYAACRIGHVVASGHLWETGYGYYPTARQHRLICGVIARAGRDLGAPVAPDGSR